MLGVCGVRTGSAKRRRYSGVRDHCSAERRRSSGERSQQLQAGRDQSLPAGKTPVSPTIIHQPRRGRQDDPARRDARTRRPMPSCDGRPQAAGQSGRAEGRTQRCPVADSVRFRSAAAGRAPACRSRPAAGPRLRGGRPAALRKSWSSTEIAANSSNTFAESHPVLAAQPGDDTELVAGSGDAFAEPRSPRSARRPAGASALIRVVPATGGDLSTPRSRTGSWFPCCRRPSPRLQPSSAAPSQPWTGMSAITFNEPVSTTRLPETHAIAAVQRTEDN